MAFQEFYGLFFDPQTGQSFTKNERDVFVSTPFTFVEAFTNGQALNPFHFATEETASKIRAKLETMLPNGWKVSVREGRFAEVSFVVRSAPERFIDIVTDTGFRISLNAGLIASSVIRIGWKTTINQILDEVAYAQKEANKED